MVKVRLFRGIDKTYVLKLTFGFKEKNELANVKRWLETQNMPVEEMEYDKHG